MGSVADDYDNSMAESFVSTLKRELIHETCGGFYLAGGLVPTRDIRPSPMRLVWSVKSCGPKSRLLQVACTDRHDKIHAGLHGTPNRRSLLRGVNG
jgi:hypothetical protein